MNLNNPEYQDSLVDQLMSERGYRTENLKTATMNYDNLSIEELMELAHVDYLFGRTEFEELDKKYMACSYAEPISDYGYEIPEEYDPLLPIHYAGSLREVIIKAIEND